MSVFSDLRFIPPTTRKGSHQGWGFKRKGHRHGGLDFPDDKGTPVYAGADGEVTYVQNSDSGGTGRYIVIHHGNGIYSRYLHNTTNNVVKGQKVRRGQQIGTVGTTGTVSSGPHVHFDIKVSKPELVDEYKKIYGNPDPRAGYGKVRLGWGLPAETFMDGAKYTQTVIDSGAERNVVFYKSTRKPINWVGVGLAAFVVYGVWKLAS